MQKATDEPSVGQGFSLDTGPCKYQLNQFIALAESDKSGLLTGSCGGAGPETMVAQMVDELNGAGFQEVLAEAQRQVDEFLAANPPEASTATAESAE